MFFYCYVWYVSYGDGVYFWSFLVQVSFDFSFFFYWGSYKFLYMEGEKGIIFQLYEFIVFYVYKEISDNVYFKINFDFMYIYFYLNFYLVYIYICKEENVFVCGVCILVEKNVCIFCLQ